MSNLVLLTPEIEHFQDCLQKKKSGGSRMANRPRVPKKVHGPTKMGFLGLRRRWRSQGRVATEASFNKLGLKPLAKGGQQDLL